MGASLPRPSYFLETSVSLSHHLAAVWFADVVGYTRLSEENEGEAVRPISRDAVDAPAVHVLVATAFLLAGDRDAAFRVLDALAGVPSSLSSASLRLNPIYDSLRDDPRYPELLEKLEAAERSGTGTR